MERSVYQGVRGGATLAPLDYHTGMVHTLVYFELHETMASAITREKQIKKWNRQWKINLIEEKNLHWNDLWESIQ